jgi:Rad3-related DNA helicase
MESPSISGNRPSSESAEAAAATPVEAAKTDIPPRRNWIYTVSVRSLCEFTAKRGDLDRRFTPSATALEGQNSQITVANRRGPAYETEVPLQGFYETLRVRGRADGYDPERRCLEEIKAIRGGPEDIAENRRQLHWAQLATYGALFCHSRQVDEIDLVLIYFDVVTQTEAVLRERCSATDLTAAFNERCQQFFAWATEEAGHRSQRDAALLDLPFPPGEFRPGQRGMAQAVYRAATQAKCLLVEAPTGIGKTIGTIFPLLRAMPGQRLDKIAYLTSKGTGRITALAALAQLRDQTPGRALRVLTLVAKDQACEHPDKACHGDSCPLARGFYDRLAAARAEAVGEAWLDAPAQRRIALRHDICPYYFGQEMLRWTDVVVGDVHHAFDAHGQLHGLAQALGWRLGVLIDEAHNLLDRARQMYSAELSLARIRSALRIAPTELRPAFGRFLRAAREVADEQTGAYSALASIPDALADAMQEVIGALAEYLQRAPLTTGPLLNFHFEVLRFQRMSDRFASHSVFDIARDEAAAESARAPQRTLVRISPVAALKSAQRDANLSLIADDDGDGLAPGADFTGTPAADAVPSAESVFAAANRDAVFSIRNVVPAIFLRPRFEACHTVTLFSATLGTADYQRDLLGLPDDTRWLAVPPVFPPENLVVRIADRVSTRFPHRAASLDAVVDLMATQFGPHPGNYLAFFSSLDYMDQAATRLAQRHPAIPQWRQARAMDESARRDFLARFHAEGQGIAFAVLGGAFAEGVDLPGKRLIGAFVATLGLPPLTPVQEQFRTRLDTLFGAGHGYADLVPGMQKVIQAAGRVLRSPEDRGWLWLIDDRYRRAAVQKLLPGWWGLGEG